MFFIGISINHNTAPVELREAVHLTKDETARFIPILKSKFFSEGFVLSTCNRTEIFGFPKMTNPTYTELQNTLAEFKGISALEPKHFKTFFSCGAAKHIFKVASGTDSLVIGDSQILGQLKESFMLASDLNFSSTIQNRLFDFALKAGKRTISETAIGEGAVSVSYAAIQVIEKIFSHLEDRSALVIGAGETGSLAAVHLKEKNIGTLAVTNRTTARAESLADKCSAEIILFNHFKEHLHSFDIIVSATGAQGFILSKDDIASAVRKRKGKPICIMDIAVPRDIDSNVRKIDNVFYHDVDSLKLIIDQNIKKREKAVPLVNSIINEELTNFFTWYNTLEVVPTIKHIRDFFEEIRRDEMEKIKFKVHDEDYKKLDEMSKRLIGRLLHNPTVKLRQIAETGTNYQDALTYASIFKDLFSASTEQNGSSDERQE